MASPLVLIFGESANDVNAIRHLIPALLDKAKAVDCRPVREPGTLSRTAEPKKRRALAKAIAIKADLESRRRKVAVVVHEDSDACEDAHVAQGRQIVSELKESGIINAVPAVAAWEIEAWWMLFPEALQSCRGCWSKVTYGHRAVGLIENAKEVLTRDLRPKGKVTSKCPDYAESDSVRVAQEVERRRLCDDGRINRSRSLKAFKDALDQALS